MMALAEFMPTNKTVEEYVRAYELALKMPDTAPFTVPSWFIRSLLEKYLSDKNLSDIKDFDFDKYFETRGIK